MELSLDNKELVSAQISDPKHDLLNMSYDNALGSSSKDVINAPQETKEIRNNSIGEWDDKNKIRIISVKHPSIKSMNRPTQSANHYRLESIKSMRGVIQQKIEDAKQTSIRSERKHIPSMMLDGEISTDKKNFTAGKIKMQRITQEEIQEMQKKSVEEKKKLFNNRQSTYQRDNYVVQPQYQYEAFKYLENPHLIIDPELEARYTNKKQQKSKKKVTVLQQLIKIEEMKSSPDYKLNNLNKKLNFFETHQTKESSDFFRLPDSLYQSAAKPIVGLIDVGGGVGWGSMSNPPKVNTRKFFHKKNQSTDDKNIHPIFRSLDNQHHIIYDGRGRSQGVTEPSKQQIQLKSQTRISPYNRPFQQYENISMNTRVDLGILGIKTRTFSNPVVQSINSLSVNMESTDTKHYKESSIDQKKQIPTEKPFAVHIQPVRQRSGSRSISKQAYEQLCRKSQDSLEKVLPTKAQRIDNIRKARSKVDKEKLVHLDKHKLFLFLKKKYTLE